MDISRYMALAHDLLQAAFPGRIVCLGLQGSFARGEATEKSDIDLAVVLDRVELADILTYRGVLDRLPARERACGFFSGKEELLAWDRGELFQFYHDTRVYSGSLEFLCPLLDQSAVERAVHTAACGIYHACVHNLLHAQSGETLRGIQKAAFFALQAKCWLEQGVYCHDRQTLAGRLEGADREILEELPGETLEARSRLLLEWSGGLIRSMGRHQ